MGLEAFKNLVELAENNGLEGPELDAAREAYCRLAGIAHGDEIGPYCRKPYMERRV